MSLEQTQLPSAESEHMLTYSPFTDDDFWDENEIAAEEEQMWSQHRPYNTAVAREVLAKEIESAYVEDAKEIQDIKERIELERYFRGEPSPDPYPNEWKDEFREYYGIIQATGNLSLDEMIDYSRLGGLPPRKPVRKSKLMGYQKISHFDQQVDPIVEAQQENAPLKRYSELDAVFVEAAASGDYAEFIGELHKLREYDGGRYEIIDIIDDELIPYEIPADGLSARTVYNLHEFWKGFDGDKYQQYAPEPELIHEAKLLEVETTDKKPKYIDYDSGYEDKVIVHPYDAALDVEEYLKLLQQREVGRYTPMQKKIAFRNHRDAVLAAEPAKVQELAIVFHIDSEVASSSKKNPIDAEQVLDDLNESYYNEEEIGAEKHPLYTEMKALEVLMADKSGGAGLKEKPSIRKTVLSPNQARLADLRALFLKNENYYDGSRSSAKGESVEDFQQVPPIAESDSARPRNNRTSVVATPMSRKFLKPKDHPKILLTTQPIFR